MLQVSLSWSLLVFSLIESKLILPAHLAHMKNTPYDPKKANALQRFRDFFAEGIKVFIYTKYVPFLKKAIKNRYTTLATFIGIFILTIGLFTGGIVKFVFFPTIPSDFMFANVELEQGSSLIQRDKAIRTLMQSLDDMDVQLQRETGEGAVKHSIAFSQGALGGQVFVELSKGEDRSITDIELYDRWRDKVPEIPGVKTFNIGAPGGPGGGSDLSFEFSGKNIDNMRFVADELKDFLSQYEGVSDINDSFANGSDEIRINIKPLGEALGLSLSSLAHFKKTGGGL